MKSIVFFLLFFPMFSNSYAEARLTGKVANYTTVFKEDKKVRSHRYEASAKQTSNLSSRLSTVIEGRLWWDTPLMQNAYATRAYYGENVREDELFEGEARNVYVDYLGEYFRVKAGRQVIDWTNSPSTPAIIDVLTPLDLRHGIEDTANEAIVPVDALSLSHSFLFEGTLEWLVIPEGKHHRLPTGDNGFGYYNYLKQQVAPRSLVIKEEKIPRTQDQVEAGLRYQATLASIDMTLLGFHGHQRSPAYKVLATDKAVEVTQYYPQENTFGATFGYAYDALVTRFITFYEPKRVLRNQAADNPFDGDRVYDQRMVGGVGFDWVFNNHLKFYSEQYVTRLETVVPGDATAEEEAVSGVIDEYVASFRVTNETFENILMSFEAVITAPERSRALIPKVEWTFADNYKIAGGARLFSSSHTDSRFESLKHSSYYFVRLESNFDAGQILR